MREKSPWFSSSTAFQVAKETIIVNADQNITKSLERLLERERMVAEIVDNIRAQMELESILREAVNSLGRFTQADRCQIWLYNPETRNFHAPCQEYRANENVPPLNETLHPDIPIFSSNSHWTEIMNFSDIGQAEGLTDLERQLIQERGIKSFLHVPILYKKDQFLGDLRVHSVFEKRVWDTETISLLRYVAAQVAVAIYQAKILQDLRNSEARKAGVLETSLDAIITTDAAGIVHEWNASAERIFGYTRQEAIGSVLTNMIVPERNRELHRKWLAFMTTEETSAMGIAIASTADGAELPVLGSEGIELPCLRADGTEFPCSLIVQRIPVAGPRMFTRTIRDLTKRKQAEREIKALTEELEQRVIERTAQLEAVNQELEAFSYSVSHDLRAPLRAIDGFSHSLLEECADALSDQGRHYLNRVRQASQQMNQLIDDMLQLSRLTRGQMTVETVDLSSIAKKIASELQEQQPDRQARFEIADNIIVQGDRSLLQAVMQNLLDNAWKYTSKHDTARIVFGLMEYEGRPTYFVRDDGAGFDMQYAQKLFGAFQRLHGTTEFPGTGVGLATVARIIHRHGGKIWAEAEVEKGATFYFTLGSVTKERVLPDAKRPATLTSTSSG